MPSLKLTPPTPGKDKSTPKRGSPKKRQRFDSKPATFTSQPDLPDPVPEDSDRFRLNPTEEIGKK